MRNRILNLLLWTAIISRMAIGREINFEPRPPRKDLAVVYLEQPLEGCETTIANDTLIFEDKYTNLRLLIGIQSGSNVHIENNYITGLRYGIFEKAYPLKCLNLSHNAIEPEKLLSFGPVSNLTKLFLAHQRLSSQSHSRTLGPSTFHFPNLEYLSVRNSSIHILPANFLQMFPNLHYLDLSDNPLIMPEWTRYLPASLKTLHLERIGAKTLWFQELKNVQALYLDGNQFERIGNYYFPSFLHFQNITELEVLSLKNCSIKMMDFDAFSLNPKLRSLDLSFNQINDVDPRVYELPFLTSLSLSHNQLETFDSGVPVHSLKHLSLSYNKLGTIPRNLNRFPNLERLSLRGNRISHVHQRTFHGLGSLREFDLAENRINILHHGWDKDLSGLRILNLESNKIFHIHHMLNRQSGVKQLFIRNNNLWRITNKSFWYLPDDSVVYV